MVSLPSAWKSPVVCVQAPVSPPALAGASCRRHSGNRRQRVRASSHHVHTFNFPRVLCQLYLCKAGKRKGCKPEPLLGESRTVCTRSMASGTERLCRESLYLGAGDEGRGPRCRDLGAHGSCGQAGSRWQHRRLHPGKEGRAPPPSLSLEVTSLLPTPAPALSGLGELAGCRPTLGSRLQAVLLLLSRFSRVRLFAAPQTAAHQAPLPWDSPGKNTGVGCHFLLQCMEVKSEREVAQSCLTPIDPMDFSLPGSSVHGIFQARVLEWGATACAWNLNSLHPSGLIRILCFEAAESTESA